MATMRQDKIDAGFIPVIGYCNGRHVELTNYCTRKRYVIVKDYSDADGSKLYRLLYTDKKDDKKVVCLLNGNMYEKEYLYFALRVKGYEDIEFTDGYEVAEMTKYFAERKKRDVTNQLTVAVEDRMKKGISTFTHTPYGYYLRNGKIHEDSYESYIVKYAFKRRKEGAGKKKIAKELSTFTTRGGHRITPSTIQRIFDNEHIYKGYVTYRGVTYKGNHKRFLDEDGNVTGAIKAPRGLRHGGRKRRCGT